MKCPRCRTVNRDGVKFCEECGTRFETECPACKSIITLGKNFCGECGHKLTKSVDPAKTIRSIESERKHVTILFSDLSGYTAITEKLDPEEVKGIMSQIFGKITDIIKNYDGYIERFIGDAVMAVLGVPKAHEDDPIRAIKAAMEIHATVEKISPQFEKKIGRALTMHTGINTGLVITGEVDLEKGTHGLTGDAINLASRLVDLAKPNEIIVGPITHSQAYNYFEFETLKPTKVKGKHDAIRIYKVLSIKNKPIKIHRLQGLRAKLIGRVKELAILQQSIETLKRGEGSIVSITGDAGTGKSRLKSEFKATLNLKNIQWREGHAYSYTQTMPYYPLINLLTRAFRIEESDSKEIIRDKIEAGITSLPGKIRHVVPYVGGLFSLPYPETEYASPEYWKPRLYESIKDILAAMVARGPTVICFEDLHWMDPSFVELLRGLIKDFHHKVLFICIVRPYFTLFENLKIKGDDIPYRIIRLQELSAENTASMLQSLLGTEAVPMELIEFIDKKAEGNPFYLEEVVNTMIETDLLVRSKEKWELSREISESEVPVSIQGVLAARIDRLDRVTKKVLQEAAVIGRAFLYKILKKITDIKVPIDDYLGGLEQMDLIRARTVEPDLEYIFKHAFTQDVVYSGLLKEERQEAHERVGLAIEHLFPGRLSEFYETLAYHFQRGHSFYKALDYLIKAGEKCLNLFSLEESEEYFKTAFDLILKLPEKGEKDKEIIADILSKWSMVYYYNGLINEQYQLLSNHEKMVDSLEDKARRSMFKSWMGWALWMNGKPEQAHEYLKRALEIGEELKDNRIIGYTCTWLSWCLLDLGKFDVSSNNADRASKLALSMGLNHYCYFKPLACIGQRCWFTGDWKTALEIGADLLEYGEKYSNSRCLVLGNMCFGIAYGLIGKFQESIGYYIKAEEASGDPFYYFWVRGLLGSAYLLNGQVEEAIIPVKESFEFCYKYGALSYGHLARLSWGILLIFQGKMSAGMRIFAELNAVCVQNGRNAFSAVVEYFIGKVYLELVAPSKPVGLSTMISNATFLAKNLPFATKRAEKHLKNAIEISKKYGADQFLGQALIELGRLYRKKKRKNEAESCIKNAIQVFEKYENDFHLTEAKTAFESL